MIRCFHESGLRHNKKIFPRWWKLSVLFFLGIVFLPRGFAGPEDHFVKIFVSKAEIDRSSPWQLEEVSQQSALGVVVDGGRILTTALSVANSTLIEMQVFGANKRHEMDVEFADYEVNLAVLRPKDPNQAFLGLVPLDLGDDLEIDDQVEIFRARDLYQLTKMPGSLQEVGVYTAVTSYYGLVAYLIKVQQTGLGWAEPVLKKGKLVALASGQDAHFVHAIPVDIIRHFLQDQLGPKYRGFPSIGLQLTPLIDPTLRRMLKADSYGHGMRIAAVFGSSPFMGKVQKDDILLEIDGLPISEHGYFQHAKWGKVYLKHLITRKYAGDSMQLKILRGGVAMDVQAVLPKFASNDFPVVGYRYEQGEPHLIFGGLLFQELSQDYLKQWGKNWRSTAPIDLMYVLENANLPDEDTGKRIIFLSRVLPDLHNRGYEKLRYQIVTSINDRAVHSINEVRQAFETPVLSNGQQFARVKLALEGGEIILSYSKIQSAHQRIAKTYGISTKDSFFDPQTALRPVITPM
jgi:S1-C subfamily serine protease